MRRRYALLAASLSIAVAAFAVYRYFAPRTWSHAKVVARYPSPSGLEVIELDADGLDSDHATWVVLESPRTWFVREPPETLLVIKRGTHVEVRWHTEQDVSIVASRENVLDRGDSAFASSGGVRVRYEINGPPESTLDR